MNGATLVFVPLAVIAVVLATVAVARLLRGLGPDTQLAGQAGGDAADLDASARLLGLEGEKQRILMQLRDLEHEYALGKLSEEDYDGLKRHFEAEAIRVLDALEKAR
jgi:hypothetical protein